MPFAVISKDYYKMSPAKTRGKIVTIQKNWGYLRPNTLIDDTTGLMFRYQEDERNTNNYFVHIARYDNANPHYYRPTLNYVRTWYLKLLALECVQHWESFLLGE